MFAVTLSNLPPGLSARTNSALLTPSSAVQRKTSVNAWSEPPIPNSTSAFWNATTKRLSTRGGRLARFNTKEIKASKARTSSRMPAAKARASSRVTAHLTHDV